jgi:hypothetical protein
LKKSQPNVVRHFFYCRKWEQNNCKFLQITAYSYSFQHVNKEKGLTKQAIATQKRESEKRSPPTKPPTENKNKNQNTHTHTHTHTYTDISLDFEFPPSKRQAWQLGGRRIGGSAPPPKRRAKE